MSVQRFMNKPLTEWTDIELRIEHDAASYFANGSDDAETIEAADKRLHEIEAEMDRRAVSASGGAE